jgi:hypothetical protein
MSAVVPTIKWPACGYEPVAVPAGQQALVTPLTTTAKASPWLPSRKPTRDPVGKVLAP